MYANVNEASILQGFGALTTQTLDAGTTVNLSSGAVLWNKKLTGENWMRYTSTEPTSLKLKARALVNKETGALLSSVRVELLRDTAVSSQVVTVSGGSEHTLLSPTYTILPKSTAAFDLPAGTRLPVSGSDSSTGSGGGSSTTSATAASREEVVKKLQRALIAAGHSVGSAGADGKYGKNTHNALKAWTVSVGGTFPSSVPLAKLGFTASTEANVVIDVVNRYIASQSSRASDDDGDGGHGGGSGGGTQFLPYEEEKAGLGTLGWALISGGVIAALYFGYRHFSGKKSKGGTGGLRGLGWIDRDRAGNVRLDTHELSLWVDNDEGLYNWWKGSRQSKSAFIRENRDELKRLIQAQLDRKPARSLYGLNGLQGLGKVRFSSRKGRTFTYGNPQVYLFG